ncbi:MAG TPA: response regulator [Candidatus Omnitrophota bacterium]|nr:response regulator [Candidatus Omnitrophota bacterium]HPT08062.1 response regulator [Candidatus Omnitrophota bacterium]
MGNRVLICDDETPVRELFSDLLKKQLCDVATCMSGEEALDIVTKETFDVVLLDIKLGGMSGLETLKKIKDTKPETIVIMITGFGYDEQLISKCKEYGCSGYIGKNMPISQIISNFKLFVKSAKEKTA